MHPTCGQDHAFSAACPPPSEAATTRTEWAVVAADGDTVPFPDGEQAARTVAKRLSATAVYRTVTVGPWTEAPPWDDHEEPA